MREHVKAFPMHRGMDSNSDALFWRAVPGRITGPSKMPHTAGAGFLRIWTLLMFQRTEDKIRCRFTDGEGESQNDAAKQNSEGQLHNQPADGQMVERHGDGYPQQHQP